MADEESATSTGRDRVGLIVVEDIAKAYDFGEDHPLRPERVLVTYEHIRTLGFTASASVIEIPSRSATDDEILAVHEALETLAKVDPRLVSVVEMRYFAGLSDLEIAAALGLSDRTVRRDWDRARLLLAEMLGR
jgi:DNA-directed RNA polymerase specialized sigma24 family protein